MIVHKELHLRKLCFLCSLLLAMGSMVGVENEVRGESRQEINAPQDTGNAQDLLSHKKEVDVADKDEKFAECNLVEDEPIPPFNESELHPCEPGVPKIDVAHPKWSCPPVGTIPQQTCHWAYENKLGCDGGGAGKMCDTVPSGGGTACECKPR